MIKELQRTRETEMIFLVLGSIAFLLFFLYDWNSYTIQSRVFHSFFCMGFLLLILSTGGAILFCVKEGGLEFWRVAVFGLLALTQLGLLIFTLFFALPFRETYRETPPDGKPCVNREGVYALCRHPGALWFFFFYLFLAIMTKEGLMYQICFLYSFWNLIYVLFQDRVTFRKTFADYDTYQASVPFLIPTGKSIRRCLSNYLQRG